MLLSPRKNSLASLFKEVRVFKVSGTPPCWKTAPLKRPIKMSNADTALASDCRVQILVTLRIFSGY